MLFDAKVIFGMSSSEYMILEWAEGGDLYHDIVQRRKKRPPDYYDEDIVWDIFEQVCSGLAYLHEKKIVHRDIKSLNILRCKSKDGAYIYKIADLGVGRQLSPATQMLNTFYGTPLYASPELCDNKSYTEKTDIWSFGVVLYELVALEVPFQANSLLALAQKICRGAYKPIPQHYSSGLARLIEVMLQMDHRRRPSSRRILGWLHDRNSQPNTSATQPQHRETREEGARHPLPSPHHRPCDDTSAHCSEAGSTEPSDSSEGESPAHSFMSHARKSRDSGRPLLSTRERQKLEVELRRAVQRARRLEDVMASLATAEGQEWHKLKGELMSECSSEGVHRPRTGRSEAVSVASTLSDAMSEQFEALKDANAEIASLTARLAGEPEPTRTPSRRSSAQQSDKCRPPKPTKHVHSSEARGPPVEEPSARSRESSFHPPASPAASEQGRSREARLAMRERQWRAKAESRGHRRENKSDRSTPSLRDRLAARNAHVPVAPQAHEQRQSSRNESNVSVRRFNIITGEYE